MRWLIAAGVYALILLPALLAPVGQVHARAYLLEFVYHSAGHAVVEMLANAAAFVPLGWCVHRGARQLGLAPRAALVLSVAGAALFSWSIETVQYFLALRFSSIFDVLTNTLGGVAGAVAADAPARRR